MVTKQKKQEIVCTLKESVQDSSIVFAADYTGMNMEEFTNLRKALKGKAKCIVAKNTLTEIAFKDGNFSAIDKFLIGPTLLVIGKNDASEAIKGFQKFQDSIKPKLILKGGVLPDDGKALDANSIEAIGKLPSKEVLLAQIAYSLTAVPATVAQSINQIIGNIGELAVKVAEKQNK